VNDEIADPLLVIRNYLANGVPLEKSKSATSSLPAPGKRHLLLYPCARPFRRRVAHSAENVSYNVARPVQIALRFCGKHKLRYHIP
jgi:hypothetical protein